MPKQGWLAKQVDSVEKEIEAWPEWMRDLRLRMRGAGSDRILETRSDEQTIEDK
jgi:hypothetical protein